MSVHPALKRHGLSEAQARALARKKAGLSSGGMATIALMRKGFITEDGCDLTPAGEDVLAAIRKEGW